MVTKLRWGLGSSGAAAEPPGGSSLREKLVYCMSSSVIARDSAPGQKGLFDDLEADCSFGALQEDTVAVVARDLGVAWFCKGRLETTCQLFFSRGIKLPGALSSCSIYVLTDFEAHCCPIVRHAGGVQAWSRDHHGGGLEKAPQGIITKHHHDT